ncbi:hypothetical protein HK096_005159, partial [Nowakowskiella sp. JEL0078]
MENTSTIGELAEGADKVRNKNAPKTRRSFAIPFGSIMFIITVFIFSLAIIPTCIIVFGASNSVTTDLSKKSVIINLSKQLSEMFIYYKSAADAMAGHDSTLRVMGNLSSGYGNHDDINRAALMILRTFSMLDICCIQRNNINANSPVMPPGIKLYPFYQWHNLCGATIQTQQHVFRELKFVNDVKPYDYLIPSFVENSFMAKKLSNCAGSTGNWNSEIVFGVPFFTYVNCAPDFDGVIYKNSPYTCGTAFITTTTIPKILKDLTPTDNSRLILSDSTGSVISANLNNTIYANILLDAKGNPISYVKLNQYSDSVTNDLVNLISPDHSYSQFDEQGVDGSKLSVSDFTTTISKEYKLVDGTIWITSIIKLQFETQDKFYLLLFIPRADFFGKVDSSISNGIIFSSLFTSLGVLVGILVTIGILIPLKKLQNDMKK